MSTGNNRLRRPIALHRRTKEVIQSLRVVVERRDKTFQAVKVKKMKVARS